MNMKLLNIYFIIFLLTINTSFFSLEDSIYSMRTTSIANGKKVCLVIVDGLRYDAVSNMPFLNKITKSNQGILYKGNSGLPSYSRPGYERIMTGTDSSINSIDNNLKMLPSLVPSIFKIAKDSKLKTAFSGFYWFDQLYLFQIDKGNFYYIRDGSVFKDAINTIENFVPDLMVIHPLLLDTIGHKYGGNSKEYKAAAFKIDNEIERLWNTLALKDYTLFVVSDHGHRDEGGHGDDNIKSVEIPIILIDKNLSKENLENNLLIKEQRDIAPTICNIMGIPKTIFMTGNSLYLEKKEMDKLRHQFILFNYKDFNKVFNKTSQITYIVIAIHTIIYITSMFIALSLLKSEK